MFIRISLTFMLLWPTLVFAEYRIAVVDMQKAIFQTKDGIQAKATLENEFRKVRAELAKLEESIKKVNLEYERKHSLLNVEAQQKMQIEIAEKVRRYQEEVAANETRLQKRQNELIQPIVARLEKHLASLAKAEKISLVLEKSPALVHYAEPSEDLTDRVIKQYEAGT